MNGDSRVFFSCLASKTETGNLSKCRDEAGTRASTTGRKVMLGTLENPPGISWDEFLALEWPHEWVGGAQPRSANAPHQDGRRVNRQVAGWSFLEGSSSRWTSFRAAPARGVPSKLLASVTTVQR